MIYNVKYATDPILIVAGDAIDFWINIQKYNTVTELWEDYDLTGRVIELKIYNKHGTVIKTLSTIDGSIIIINSNLNFISDAIEEAPCCGSFKAQLYIVSPKETLWLGIIKISYV